MKTTIPSVALIFEVRNVRFSVVHFLGNSSIIYFDYKKSNTITVNFDNIASAAAIERCWVSAKNESSLVFINYLFPGVDFFQLLLR